MADEIESQQESENGPEETSVQKEVSRKLREMLENGGNIKPTKHTEGFSSADEVSISDLGKEVSEQRLVEITAFYNDNFPNAPRTMAKQLSRYKDSSFKAATLEQQNRTIGLMETKRIEDGILLETLLIDPAYRGRGLGKKFFGELLKTVEIGETIVIHFRDSKKEKLEKFYNDLGFGSLSADGNYKNGEIKWKMVFIKEEPSNDNIQ